MALVLICLLAAKTSSSHLTKLYRYQSFWTYPCFVNGFIFPAWVNHTSLLPLLPQEGSHMSLPCPQLFRRSENLQEYIIIHITQKLETRKELLIPCEIWFPYAWPALLAGGCFMVTCATPTGTRSSGHNQEVAAFNGDHYREVPQSETCKS